MMKCLTRLSALVGTLVLYLCCVNGPMQASAQETTLAVATEVDRLLAEELDYASSSTAEAPLCDDVTFLRRISLDITGRLPAPEQIIAFSLDPDPAKRTKLIEQLLADEDYGRNWASYWRDVVFYPRANERAKFGIPAFERYLTTALNENVSWDEIATALITAEGDTREDGRTAIIIAQAGNPEDVVSEISRIFLGIQISCAQCHDHKTDRWKREQFHELAAFFSRVAVRPNVPAGRPNRGVRRTLLVIGTDNPRPNLPGNSDLNRIQGTLEYTMSDLAHPDAEGTVMVPTFFLTGQTVALGTSDADRRSQFAQLVTANSNEWFTKAIVNRLWSELVGEGFCEPVDDMGPDRECRTEATFSYLAQSFVEHDSDIKWLFRVITATDAYQRESRDRRRWNELPFLANCSQRLRADELVDALVPTLSLELQDSPVAGFGGQNNLRTQLNKTFGFDPSAPRSEVMGSLPEVLALLNSPILEEAIRAESSEGWGKLLEEIEYDETVVIELYLRSLSREPTDDEIKTCLDYVSEVGDRREAFEDIVWTIINSTEFLYRR